MGPLSLQTGLAALASTAVLTFAVPAATAAEKAFQSSPLNPAGSRLQEIPPVREAGFVPGIFWVGAAVAAIVLWRRRNQKTYEESRIMILQFLAPKGEVGADSLAYHFEEAAVRSSRIGALYPVLMRMEREGYIERIVRGPLDHEKRIFYRMTEKGRFFLGLQPFR